LDRKLPDAEMIAGVRATRFAIPAWRATRRTIRLALWPTRRLTSLRLRSICRS
jgi:hypothetical protein